MNVRKKTLFITLIGLLISPQMRCEQASPEQASPEQVTLPECKTDCGQARKTCLNDCETMYSRRKLRSERSQCKSGCRQTAKSCKKICIDQIITTDIAHHGTWRRTASQRSFAHDNGGATNSVFNFNSTVFNF